MHRSAYGEMNSPPPLGRNIENLIYQLNRRHDPHLNRILPPHNIQKDWTVYSDLPNSDLRNRFVQLHLQQQHHESATSLSESEFYNEDFNYDEQFTKEKVAMNLSRFGRFLEMLSRLPLPRMSFTGMGLCFLLAIFICPRACCEAILFPSFRLAFGTLYPAYASYKAVRTKNVKEYVKWMMYWIVYAFFTCIETFTDIFLSWFPFYYEFKVIIVLWLLSPATKGSSTLYRKFVHPMLTRREQEIDEYLNQARERGYTAVLQLGSKGVNYATNVIMQTALKGGGNLVQTIRRSYSLSDLSEPDVNRTQDEIDEVVRPQRFLRPRSQTVRSSSGGRQTSNMYFSEVDVEPKGPPVNYNYIRSSEDISSGYSSAEPISGGLSRTSSMTNTRSRFKAKRAEDEICLDGDQIEIGTKISLPLYTHVDQSHFYQNVSGMQGTEHFCNKMEAITDETSVNDNKSTTVVAKEDVKETKKAQENIETYGVEEVSLKKYEMFCKWLKDNECSLNPSSDNLVTNNEIDSESSEDEFKDTVSLENDDFFSAETELNAEDKVENKITKETEELKTHDPFSKVEIETREAIVNDTFNESCNILNVSPSNPAIPEQEINAKDLKTNTIAVNDIKNPEEPTEESFKDAKFIDNIIQKNSTEITTEKAESILNEQVLTEKGSLEETYSETKQSMQSFVPTNLVTNIRQLSSSIEKINEQILEACKKPAFHGKGKAPIPPDLLLKRSSSFNVPVNISTNASCSQMPSNTLNIPVDSIIPPSNEFISRSRSSSPKPEGKKAKKKSFRSYLPSLFRSDPPKPTSQPVYDDYHKETQI